MHESDVVITGLGIICPLGLNARDSSYNFVESRFPAPAPIPQLAGSPMQDNLAFRIPDFNAGELLGGRRMLKYMSEASVLGCIAAKEAAADAGMTQRFSPERTGLFAATGLATADINEVRPVIERSIDEEGNFSCHLLGKKGLASANPLLSFKILANIPPCLISIQEKIKGANLIFNPWEGQAGAALYEAWLSIICGESDCALAGGADFASHPSTYVYLRQSGILGNGEFPSAGAAYLFMEKAETAIRDNKSIYAVITEMELENSELPVNDPMSGKIGRCFAAAPAIQLALAARANSGNLEITGVDRMTFRVRLGVPS
ncbi:MAG: beta-ketoacyl synthase N-terminal-like domain-containing protein [Victivallales bacterium]